MRAWVSGRAEPHALVDHVTAGQRLGNGGAVALAVLGVHGVEDALDRFLAGEAGDLAVVLRDVGDAGQQIAVHHAGPRRLQRVAKPHRRRAEFGDVALEVALLLGQALLGRLAFGDFVRQMALASLGVTGVLVGAQALAPGDDAGGDDDRHRDAPDDQAAGGGRR